MWLILHIKIIRVSYYTVMAQQWIKRQKTGKKYTYFFKDHIINDKSDLEYFKSLVIPPAWKNVQIAKNRTSTVLATGTDKSGKTQYIYHSKYRAAQEKEKFERILRFAKALPKMRKITEKHLSKKQFDREKVLACIVRLMDQSYFRVGNDSYAKQNESYGITTLRSKHLIKKSESVTFDYIGKSGQRQVKKVSDKKLARIIKKLDELPGYEVFKYYDDNGVLRDVKSKDVNEYIKEIMGEEFSAKDFRTWGGTLYACAELAIAERSHLKKDRAKIVTTCVKKVAKKLGNTPAVARSSYIDPRIIKAYENNSLTEIRRVVESMRKQQYLDNDERCVLQTLKATS